MSKINILVIPPDAHGVGKFRILDPYTYIQENYPDEFHIDIKSDVKNDDSEFDNYQIIIIHSFVHISLSYEDNIARIEWLKKQGKIVIVDVDDYWTPYSKSPIYKSVTKDGIPQKKINLIKSASYLTVTTPIFRDTIKNKFGLKNIFVFPNAIDETEAQYIPNPTESDRLRFGWLGGSSHQFDIELLREGIPSGLYYNKDKVQYVLCGFDTRGNMTEINEETGEQKVRPILPQEAPWYQYEKIFTNNYDERIFDKDYLKFLQTYREVPYDDVDKPYRRRWTMNINKYATNYNYFDVSMAPLVDTDFNVNKSQLKIIEAGFHKKAIIASEVRPYTLDLINSIEKGGTFNTKGNSLLVSSSKNHKDWGKHMVRLIQNPNLVKDLGEKLYETVKDTYSLRKVSADRVQFLKTIINK